MIFRESKDIHLKDFLKSAYDEYYPTGDMPDFAAIVLGKLEDGDADFDIRECLSQVENLDSLNESSPHVSEPKIVRERRGSGISISVDGHEYRYVSPDRTTKDLFRSVHGMWEHGAGFRVLNYLRKNALCYFGSRNPNSKAEKMMGV